MLVEFHGEQHDKPYSFRHQNNKTLERKEVNLAKTKHNDIVKMQWCKDNNSIACDSILGQI